MMFRFLRRARASAEPVEPVWVDLSEPDALTRLREAVAQWVMGETWSRESVLIACELLADGVDGPALRGLAGLGFAEGWVDSDGVVRETFRELGLEFAEDGSDAATVLALRARCRVFVAGMVSEREFLSSISRYAYYYDSPAVMGDIVDLAYRMGESGDVYGSPVPVGAAERYAREFLAATA